MNTIGFGREVTSHLDAALRREWLVTNGIGGYASGTVAMANTRRFHGLLVAALRPPLGRTLLVSKLETTVRLGGESFPITTNEYIDGTLDPNGYLNLESFTQEGLIPVFTWAIADNLLQQRVWMSHGQNTTYVTYTLMRATRPVALEIIPLCTYRLAHEFIDIRGWMPSVRSVKGGLRVDSGSGAEPYWLHSNHGTFVPGVVRHWSQRHRHDNYRGLEDKEDLFAIGRLAARLKEGETLVVVLSAERGASTDWESAQRAERERQSRLLAQSGLDDAPVWIRRLVLASDQFVVDIPHPVKESAAETTRRDSPHKSIIAGYPWLGERLRDAMISLPGLTLATGRTDVTGSVLRAFAHTFSERMTDAFIPDASDQEQIQKPSTVDGTLWFFQALHLYFAYTGDHSFVQALLPRLIEMLDGYAKGTHSGVGIDAEDGLLRTSEDAAGLTWMNARDGDRIITPRVGKQVELNALWYNALATLAQFASELGEIPEATRWRDMASRVADCFEDRFWCEPGRYLYDVVDSPDGDDATLRPNQILAVSLPYSPIQDPVKARSVVDTVARYLQTSYGLRTLSPRNHQYVQRYGGNRSARANACHQGTVWAWLIGPFVEAHMKVYADPEMARTFIQPFSDHLDTHGVGTISEMFDAEPPHTARGCIAYACSVGQVLCGWRACAQRFAGQGSAHP